MGNRIADHSDVVGASPIGAAPTTSSFSTWHPASRDSAKAVARQYENLLNVWDLVRLILGIWLYVPKGLFGDKSAMIQIVARRQAITLRHQAKMSFKNNISIAGKIIGVGVGRVPNPFTKYSFISSLFYKQNGSHEILSSFWCSILYKCEYHLVGLGFVVVMVCVRSGNNVLIWP